MRSNENAQSIWDTARADFGNDCDEIIRNYDNDFYDEELQKKIEELYSRIHQFPSFRKDEWLIYRRKQRQVDFLKIWGCYRKSPKIIHAK